MYKHVLFDCDGVLIDTEIVAAEVVTAWLNTQGVEISIETYISEYTGKTFSDIINILKSKNQLPSDIDLSLVVPQLDEQIKENQRPIEGVWEMLKSISVPMSCVSNSAKDYVELAFKKLDITEHFGGRIFSAEMVEKGKPSPLVYELALEKLDLTKETTLVVEDSEAGVAASVAAGLKTIGFLGGSHVIAGHAEALQSLGTYALASDHQELQLKLKELLEPANFQH